MLIRYGAGVDSRVRLIGAAASVGLRDSSMRSGQANLPAAGGFDKTSSMPVGNRSPVSFVPAQSDGGMAARVSVRATTLASIVADGQLASSILVQANTVALANAGFQITATVLGQATTTAEAIASGSLASTLKIGATPSAIDIADQVWSRFMTPFNEVGTFGEKLQNLTSGGASPGLVADVAAIKKNTDLIPAAL